MSLLSCHFPTACGWMVGKLSVHRPSRKITRKSWMFSVCSTK